MVNDLELLPVAESEVEMAVAELLRQLLDRILDSLHKDALFLLRDQLLAQADLTPNERELLNLIVLRLAVGHG